MSFKGCIAANEIAAQLFELMKASIPEISDEFSSNEKLEIIIASGRIFLANVYKVMSVTNDDMLQKLIAGTEEKLHEAIAGRVPPKGKMN